MAVSTPDPVILSDSNMSQVERQIHAVEIFNGDPSTLHTFITRIDFILALYQTTDERQKLILYGHIERNISGDVIRTLGTNNFASWIELRTRMILYYKPQTPNHHLLEEFRNTQYRGNIRQFLEEAERRRQILMSKLELENNIAETTLFTRLVQDSIENLIQKLPNHIHIRIINCHIPDLRSLINILQEKGLYETPTSNKDNFKPVHNSSRTPINPQNRQVNSQNKPITPFQPFHNNVFQPYYQPYPYTPAPAPRFNQNPFPQYQQRPIHPQSNIPIMQQPRPNPAFNRQNIFDQNRFGLNHTGISTNFQSTGNAQTNHPIKRQRPSDSGQSKMSTEELRYQETVSNQPEYPYYYYCPYYPDNFQPQPYPCQMSYTPDPIQNPPEQDYDNSNTTQQEQMIPNDDEPDDTEQAENFRLVAPDQANI